MTSAGEMIGGRYELRKETARHGLACVFEAHDRVHGHAVRVKYLAFQGEHGRALLKRESRLLAMLAGQTSGTLAFHDLVEQEGVLYQVTEHVRGLRLRDWHEQKPSPRQIARVYAHLARVLHEMHAADVVHRDIKPAFVMVVEDDLPGRIKITDLELAVRTTEPDTIKAAGQLAGTFPYMSPEMLQYQGATSASDVFALGCMLVEALTGNRPWQQPGWQSVDRLSAPPDLHGLAGSALGELVSSMLALSPDARPPAAEVARVLASFADPYPA
jgi:serine/threonine protein kinase